MHEEVHIQFKVAGLHNFCKSHISVGNRVTVHKQFLEAEKHTLGAMASSCPLCHLARVLNKSTYPDPPKATCNLPATPADKARVWINPAGLKTT